MGKGVHKIMKRDALLGFYRSQQADGTAGAQTSMRDWHSYLLQDDSLPPPADLLVDHIGEESADEGETW
jgi:hypothetical protein